MNQNEDKRKEQMEQDACGIGAIVRMDGEREHVLVEQRADHRRTAGTSRRQRRQRRDRRRCGHLDTDPASFLRRCGA